MSISERKKRLSLGTLIKEKRLKQNISQEILARKLSIDKNTVYRIEKGMFAPRGFLLLELIKVLNIDIKEVFYAIEKI